MTATHLEVVTRLGASEQKIASLAKDVDNLLVSRKIHMDRVAALEAVSGPTWKTADGTVLRMREMKTGHIVNAIRYLEEKVDRDRLANQGKLAEWSAKWEPKLTELKAEKGRRERAAANEAKWAHLHNGTGPYAPTDAELPPGRYKYQVSHSPIEKLHGLHIDGVIIDEASDCDKTIETCKRKFWHNMEPEIGVNKFRQACDYAKRLKDIIADVGHDSKALKRALSAVHGPSHEEVEERKPQRIRYLESEIERYSADAKKMATKLDELTIRLEREQPSDESTIRYWKTSAAARLETVLRLRQTVVVLRDEVRRLKEANQMLGRTKRVDQIRLHPQLTELVRQTNEFQRYSPGTRGRKLRDTVEALVRLLDP